MRKALPCRSAEKHGQVNTKVLEGRTIQYWKSGCAWYICLMYFCIFSTHSQKVAPLIILPLDDEWIQASLDKYWCPANIVLASKSPQKRSPGISSQAIWDAVASKCSEQCTCDTALTRNIGISEQAKGLDIWTSWFRATKPQPLDKQRRTRHYGSVVQRYLMAIEGCSQGRKCMQVLLWASSFWWK